MIRLQDFVEAQLYASEEALIQDALRHLLRNRPDLRVQLAIHRYQTEDLSLAKAADLAGVSWAQMRDILLERGIECHLGPETLAEAEAEIESLRDYFQAEERLRADAQQSSHYPLHCVSIKQGITAQNG